ncbi:TonB-dependent siderophore receptor [Pseudothauera rhizosphaerae]|uniref:TonB-dependent siderophore receptor n=1 Tax=Pseudothauera rhizosphaerae TaxID=2565932 RepID=A0A4S4AM73_9RHOO|nr:TonB-dependent receptor [Pseudothauera rhizosphaerae]THF60152.1 TonB-dependent siderophore receptor [Pseudothauera rhizosphaerae]
MHRHSLRHGRPLDPVLAAVRRACVGLALAAPLALPAAALAQHATPQTAKRHHDIPAGPLGTALSRFAGAAGVVLSFDAALTAGKESRGLQGDYGVDEGFARLLGGSGLEAVNQGGGNYLLRRAPPPPAGGEATLAPVQVTAEAERSGTTEGTGSFTTRSMSSATHLPLTLRETPQSVTVLTSARIAADNLVDLVDIAKATPGLSLQSQDIRPVLESRGYIIENVTQDGIATRYDWYSGDSLGNLAMQDRVEVVRGATGLMQGGGNPSAAVNMIRKRPTNTWQFKGSISAGSWDDYRLMADVSGPLTEDGRVRARVVGFGQDASDFYDHAFNDKRLGYVTVDIDLTERTTLNLGYSHLYSNKNLSWGGMPTSYGFQHLDLSRSTFVGADWEYNKNEANTFYANLLHDLGAGWKLNFNGTYVDGRYDLLATSLLPTPPVGYGHVWWAAQTTRKQKAADLNVTGPVSWFGRQHDLAFGATVNRQDSRVSEWFEGWDALITSGVDLSTWNHVAPRPDTSSTSPWLSKYSTHYKQDSLYSAGKFNIADTLDLLLGARLDWYERGDTLGGRGYSVNAHLTKYAGLTWKFEKQHSAYVSYTDVFQPQNERDQSGSTLSPKVGKNYEIGVKGEYLGGALNGSIALFRIDESDRAVWLDDQSDCPGTIPEGCYRAAGLVRTEGVDIELQGALTPNWQIGTGFTYSETRYRKDATPANIGKRLNTMNPTTLFKLSTQYTLPGALNRLTLGGRINWQNRMYRDFANYYGEVVRNQQDARAIVDLSATYRLTRSLNVKLDINNVFDKVYYSAISGHWQWGVSEAYGRPRNAQLTLNASY